MQPCLKQLNFFGSLVSWQELLCQAQIAGAELDLSSYGFLTCSSSSSESFTVEVRECHPKLGSLKSQAQESSRHTQSNVDSQPLEPFTSLTSLTPQPFPLRLILILHYNLSHNGQKHATADLTNSDHPTRHHCNHASLTRDSTANIRGDLRTPRELPRD
jgi:hypothetical protein